MKPASTNKPTQGQLVFPLLQCISEMGGSASSSDVADELARRFDLPANVVTESSSSARGNLWRRHVRHARRKAVAMGYLEPTAGDWTLTEAGSRGIRHAQPGIVVEFVVDNDGRPVGARIDIAVTIPTTHLLVRGDARDLSWIESGSVQMVLTSPPYHNLVAYEHDDAQLGEFSSYDAFIKALDDVWRECFRVLTPGGRLAVVVGDVLRSRKVYGEHHVLPLHASILTHGVDIGFRALTGIIWRKIATVNSEGGGRGLLGHPNSPNGVITQGIEHILMLRKPGPYRSATPAQIRDSHIDNETYSTLFRDVWDDVPGQRATRGHPAPFPIRIAARLAAMFSFAGDTLLDPFGGTGTTSLAAAKTGRNSIYVDCCENYVASAVARVRDAHRELLAA